MKYLRHRMLLGGVGIILLTFAAYWPALRGNFVWDDDANITASPAVLSPDGLRQIWLHPGVTQQFYPLTHTTFWLDYHLWGSSPMPYHLENIWLHTVNAILFWMILRRLGVRGAWLAAALFAVHPVHVESVAWITERKNTLSGACFLASLFAAVEFWLPVDSAGTSGETPPGPRLRTGRRRWYWLALVFYLLALWSKTAAIALPAAVVVLVWWRKGRVGWRLIGQLVPFLMVGLGMGLITMHVEKNLGISGPQWEMSLVERGLLASRAVWFYLGKLLWPHPLIFIYPRWEPGISPPAACAAAGLALGFALLWRYRKGGARPVLCGLGCFVALIFPVLGFLNVYFFRYSFVSDHWQYLPSLGPLALAAAGLAGMPGSAARAGRFLQPVLCGAVLLTAGALTRQQTRIYRDTETLWTATLAGNPDCSIAHNNLGAALLLQEGRLDEAAVHLERAVAAEPDNAEAQNNLGSALRRQGKPAKSVMHYEQALQLKPNNPYFHNNLAWILATTPEASVRNGARAVEHAEIAYRLTGGIYPPVLNTLAAAYAEAGRYPEATAAVRQALQMASAQGNTPFVQALQAWLRLYQSGQPYRDTVPVGTIAPK